MPLAFTQEDFLVYLSVDMPISYIFFGIDLDPFETKYFLTFLVAGEVQLSDTCSYLHMRS